MEYDEILQNLKMRDKNDMEKEIGALKKAEDAPDSSKQVIIREELAQTQTPQALPLKTFVWAHEEAQKRGITNSVATCTLMIELGQSVHFSSGNETNIKLTTQGDMRLFKALLSLEEKE